jgi:hypothetical protein
MTTTSTGRRNDEDGVADAFYYFALVNTGDPAHAKATEFTRTYSGRTVTTSWVLTELADGWARPASRRAIFLQMLADLRANLYLSIEPATDELLQQGIDL